MIHGDSASDMKTGGSDSSIEDQARSKISMADTQSGTPSTMKKTATVSTVTSGRGHARAVEAVLRIATHEQDLAVTLTPEV